jgi:hypothetical protein
MVGPDKKPAMAGRDGSIGCVGTTGRDWATMKAAVLKRADGIDIPSKAYRVDVIPDAEERWEALAEHGYVTAGDVPGLNYQSATSAAGISSRTAPDEAATDTDEDPPMPPFVESLGEGQA